MSKFSIKNVFSILALAACLAPQIVRAGLDGEPAPALNIGQWIKGEPVQIKPGTNIYVVEIFGSSVKGMADRASVTNLDYLQNLYRNNGVIIVGVSDDGALKITNFVSQSGLNFDYWIAADNKRYTALTYMTPVMQRRIPYAFIVGTNGDMLWHGSPLGGLQEALKEVVEGKYDEARAKKDDLAHHQLQQYLALARQGSDRAAIAGQNLLILRTNDVPALCEMAFQISSAPDLSKRDFPLAGQALDEAERLTTTNSVEVTISRAIWLFESGKHQDGMDKATQALAYADSPQQKTNIMNCLEIMKSREHMSPKRAGGDHPAGSSGGANFKPAQGNGGGQGSSAAGSQ